MSHRTTEFEYLFQCALHKELKQKIKGKIFIQITEDDVLEVSIENFDENIKYMFRRNEIQRAIVDGLRSIELARDIVRDYKNLVFQEMKNRFFWNN